MKQLTLLFALMVATGTFKAYAQDVVYTFEAPCTNTLCPSDQCHGVGVATPSTLNTSVFASASALNPSPSLGTSSSFCGTAMNGFAAGNPNNPNRARWAQNWTSSTTINTNHYFGFTLGAVQNGYISISRVDLQDSRSGSGPLTIELRSSADNFATTIWQQTLPDNTGWRSWSITTGLPSFYNSLTFRIYAYASQTTSGAAWRIDNVKVWASVTNLPIELISFTGEKFEQDVRLRWKTASEQDNEHFTLFRSRDAIDATSWEEIGRVPGAGTSQSPIDYEYVDESPNIGTNYYLLRQTDFDGTFTSSNIVAVEFLASKDFSVFPNPTSRGSPVRTSKRIDFIFDDLGKMTRFDPNNITLEVPGVYTLVHQSENGFSETIRLIVTP
ncbi:MAG: hypothetical protein R3B39_00260 [Candidatus Paceibacterota bacterium]